MMSALTATTRVINASFFTAENEGFFNVRFADRFVTYKYVDGVKTLVKDSVVCFKAKSLLHQLKELGVFEDEDYTCNEVAELLKRAIAEVRIENYAAGDTYVDEDGVEHTYSGDGTSKVFNSIKIDLDGKTAVQEYRKNEEIRKTAEAERKNRLEFEFELFKKKADYLLEKGANADSLAQAL